MQLQVVAIGHSTLDTFIQIPQAHLHCRIDTASCELCFNFAEKIAVGAWETSIGGNAVNTGVGLARLGIKTAIVSTVGDDAAGKRVISELKGEDADNRWMKVETNGKTDQSCILNFQGERTILAYHVPRIYEFPKDFPEVNWIYLTSLNDKFADFHEKLLKWLNEHPQVKLAYNPGVHELKAGFEVNRRILRNCDVLILNKEEAIELHRSVHLHPTGVESLKILFSFFNGAGVKTVVITDGQNGTYCLDNQKFLKIQIFPAQRIEMTGAGDAFSAGFLAALVNGKGVGEALRWGTAEAAAVIEKVGATAGLLGGGELKSILETTKIYPV